MSGHPKIFIAAKVFLSSMFNRSPSFRQGSQNLTKSRFLLVAILSISTLIQPLNAERIKDLTSVAGVRNNQLLGYGLVVGLDGSGDQTSQTPFTVQSMKSMLAQFGITIPPNVNPQLKNVAAVSIQASLPAFTKPGQPLSLIHI